MKRKKSGKKWIWIVLAIFLLFPWPLAFAGDGGTVIYGNLIYQVEQVHAIYGELGTYWEQTCISIFGLPVYISPGRVVID